MRLNHDETLTAYHAVAAVIRGFHTAPPPWAIQRLYEQLDAEARNSSRAGTECCCDSEQSEQDKLISSREAAQLLGYTKRYVNRIALSLGGQMVDRVWVFSLRQVQDYAEGRDARPGPRRRAAAS